MELLLQRREWTTNELAHSLLGELPNDHDVEMVENILLQLQTLEIVDRYSI